MSTHTIIHISDAATQDAHTSNAVLQNSLMNFQEMNPSLKEANIESDNAGFFHGSASISAMPFLSTKIRCTRMAVSPFVIEKRHMLSHLSDAL